MKFEYELNYDFVEEKLSFKITKMPEKYRSTIRAGKNFNVNGRDWSIRSVSSPEIKLHMRQIYLRGCADEYDDRIHTVDCAFSNAKDIACVLKLFQKWVEEDDDEVVMTVAEIEKKLGIKNLKIVKEH